MTTVTPDEISAILNLATLLITKGVDVYGNMRALAAENGITDADLDAATARFTKEYTDPLAIAPPLPSPDPSPVGEYYHPQAAYPSVKDYKPGDRIYQRADGLFIVEPSGLGTPIPNDWRLVETVGG